MSGKRYSSSFGHRYAVTGGVGSEGSAGSGAKEGANTSFVSATADDDDISAFVQEIDSRKPLGAMRDQGAPVAGPSEDRDATVGRTTSTASRARTLSMPQPMLTTESAVDELREMNETFLASLQGLGSRRREQDDAARAARRSTSGSASGTRRLADPIAYVGSAARQEGVPLEGARVPSSGFTLPPAYVRPRFGSTGSARSAASITSEEVLGRMDPEIGDERRRSRGP
ncbi:hypothetical protein A0H81_01860 [Grifola frondosa]|uniref:Uncharacterized protein n=1 Tax=Grifola frondosa TaxID=5627 RepID=A0A1C7MMD3_GRIFR|nr:hypothetical protein A0H81_01860 [Grifola frondosa]